MTTIINAQCWNPGSVNNFTINNDHGGTTWSFNNAATNWCAEPNPLTASKSDFTHSKPVILGEIPDVIGDNTIVHDGIKIKTSGSLDLGIPACLNFTAGAALFVTRDLMALYGFKRFKECEIGLVVQRTLVEPDDASRPNFSKWHDHLKEINPLNLTYQFSDVLQTEVQTPDGKAIQAPDRSLIRMGGGIVHRSQTNLTGQAKLRTWGAFLIYDTATKPVRGLRTPYNNALSKSNTENGIPDAATIKGYQGFTPAPKARALF